jgi:hypothetical protein
MQTALVIQAILSLLDFLEPKLAEWRANGEVSQDDQLKLRNRIDQFRASDGFSGPEWEQSGTTLTMPSSGAKQVDPRGAPQGTVQSNKSGEGSQLVSGGATPPPVSATPPPPSPTAGT